MDPAAGRAGRLREHIDERRDVMVSGLLALVDRLDREGGAADRVELGGGRTVHLLAGRDLDLAHRLEARVVGPQLAELLAGVAIDHQRSNAPYAARMRAASTAAFLALSTPTVATGTPGRHLHD